MTRASVSSKSLLVVIISIAATFTALLGFTATANAQVDNFFLGDGSDGAFAAAAGTTTLNSVAPVNGAVSAGASSLTVGTVRNGTAGYAGVAGFANGRLVMVIQSTGYTGTATSGSATAIDLSSDQVSRWELARISTVAGSTLNFDAPLLHGYQATGAQVVTVPEFTTFAVAGGRTLNTPAWDGSSGGILAFLATGAVTVDGTLTTAGLGFRGGARRNTSQTGCAQLDQGNNNRKGEGIVPSFFDAAGGDTSNGVGYGNKANGAGGGNCAEGGGGAGGHGGTGGKGGFSSDGNRDVGGRGGAGLTYSLYDRMSFGGGGGSGDGNSGGNGNGAAGGGSIWARAASLAGTGTISANGAAGAASTSNDESGGGGGAGGSIYLRFTGTATGNLTAVGGNGGNTSSIFNGDGSPGGGGAGGKVLVQGSTLTGTTNIGNGLAGVRGGGGNDGATPTAANDANASGSSTLNATALVQPTSSVSSPANGSYTSDSTPTISGTGTANASQAIYVDGVLVATVTADGSGNWSYTSANLSNGAHSVYAVPTLLGITGSASATRNFTVDTVSPSVSISSPTTGSYTNDNTPTVTFTATDTNAGSTTCSVDAGAYSACSSPWTTGTLSEGVHTLNVRHTDLAGNVTTSSVSITVDTTAPLVHLNGPANGSLTNDNTPALDYMVSDLNFGTTTCSVDGGAYGACVSPMTTLSDGVHTIAMRHVDLAGNSTIVTNTFTVDATAPVAPTIVTGPTGSVSSTSATFTFSGEVGGTYQCRIDGGSWTTCTSGVNYSSLGQGSHTFEVRQIDAAGNTGPAASRTWTVDTVPPSAPTITSGPTGTVGDANASFTYTTAEPGGTVQCQIDGGSWQDCTGGGPVIYLGLGDGPHTFNVRQTDAAGNIGSVASQSWNIDTVAPAAPVINLPANNSITSNDTPTISGTAEANSTVSVYANGNLLGTTTADGSGNWSYTPGSALPDGPYAFKATSTDVANNVSVDSNTVNVTIDTTAPAAPVIVAPVDGSSTNDTTPTVSGTAEPNSTVEVFVDGSPVGTTTADGSGNWSLTLTNPLSPGDHDITATATDAAANESAESNSVTLTIDTSVPTIDITSPASGEVLGDSTPTIEFTATDDGPLTIECSVDGGAFEPCGPTDFTTDTLGDGPHSVTVRATDAGNNVATSVINFSIDTVAPNAPLISAPLSGTVTSNNQPQFSGTAEANSLVIVYAGVVALGSTYADVNGDWTFTPAGPISDGTYNVTATSTDEAGNISTPSNVVALTIDTTAPAAPVVNSPANNSVSPTNTPTVGGTAEANSTVSVYANGDLLGTTTADGSGNWSYTHGSALPDGPYAFKATSTDAANNVSVDSNTVNVTIDTTAPAAPVISSPADNTVTSNDTPTISGTAEANSLVTVYANGIYLGTTTTNGSGNWSYTHGGPLDDDTYVFTATSTDAADNTSVESNGVTVTIDTTAPAAPAINAPADNSVTSVNPPTVSGTAEANSTVSVYANGDLLGTTTADGSGNWSYTHGSALPDGPYAFKATSTDEANNVSVDSNTVNVTIDTTAPTAPVITSPTDGSSTNDTTPTISGTAEANSTVEVFVDGFSVGTTTADGSGNWSLVSNGVLSAGDRVITATATDVAGNESLESNPVTITIDTTLPLVAINSPANNAFVDDSTPTIEFSATDDGSLTIECSVDGGSFVACGPTDFTTGTLTEGGHYVTVRATDEGGNISTAVVNFTVDTLAPAAPTVSTPADGSYTTDTTPTISGTAEPNSVVAIEIDGVPHGTTTADGSGNWTYTPSSPLATGLREVRATATDAAGNTGPYSGTNEFTIDTTSPSLTIDGPANNSTINDDTPDIEFTVNDDSPVTIECNVDGQGFVPCASPYSIGPLDEGSHSVVVRVIDEAGNTSQQTVNFTIDLTAPDTALTSTPPSITNSTNATFEFTSEAGATFECNVNSGGFGPCTSPLALSGLSEGPNTIQVRATDAAGNTDPSPASYNWTIDTTAPAAPAISSPSTGSSTNDSTPTITGTAEPGSTVTVYVDGSPVGTTTTDGGGNWTFTPSTPLSEGPHVITADAEDPAGNTSPTSNPVALTIDTTAPQTTIDSGPDSPTNSDEATITFSSDDPNVTFQCSLDGATFTTCTSPLNLTGLGEGEHTLEVRAIDEAGNVDPTPDSYTWTVDTTPPGTPTVTVPSNGQITNDTTPTISGTATPGSTVTVVVDGNPIGTAVANGAGNWTLTSPVLTEGPHSIVATASDEAGNTSPNSPTVNFSVDTTPPNGDVVKQNGTGNPSQPATFDISSDDPDATSTCSVNGGTPVSCGPTFTATGLPAGNHTLVVVFTDEAGNTSTSTVNFTVVGNPTAPTPPPTAAPIDALPAACFPKGITIYELAVKGSKLNIKGFARSQYIGKEVTINFQPTKTKVIGKATVQPDGSFSLTVKAPPKKQRTKGNSRYRANVGGESSLWFKLARRMGSNLATYSNGTLNVAGALTKPLDPKATLTVTVRTGCNDPWAKVGTTKVGKSGSFKAAMPLTTDSKVVFVRMYAKVRKSAKGKATLTTYSFVVPVVTGR